MFTLPAALMVDEFAGTSAVELKAAIDAALAELPLRRNGEVCMAVAKKEFADAASTLDQYSGAEMVLRRLAFLLGETIKHGGTGKAVAPVTGTDYELPEMPKRPVHSSPVARAMSELAEDAKNEPQLASSGSGERRARKRA